MELSPIRVRFDDTKILILDLLSLLFDIFMVNLWLLVKPEGNKTKLHAYGVGMEEHGETNVILGHEDHHLVPICLLTFNK